jgi:hypothetical protein
LAAPSRWIATWATKLAQHGGPVGAVPACYLMAIVDGEGPSAAFALRQNQSKNHKKNYLLPPAYLVKENLTRCGGWFDLSNMFSILSFYFSFTPARDTNCLHLQGRFYG